MPFSPRRFAGAIRRSLRHPNGAFQDTRGNFAKTFRTRMDPKWWPFNTPRPQRCNRKETPRPVPGVIAAESSLGDEGYFAHFDEQYATTSVELEDTTAPLLSYRKAASSKMYKIKEPTPETTTVQSIDALIIDRPSSMHKISTISQQEWQTDYQLIRTLTPGNQGQVDVYKMIPTNTLTVVKKIKVEQQLPVEVLIVKNHLKSHNNVVKTIGIFYDAGPQTCNIIMEYCSGGDLFDFADHWLYKRTQQIPEIFLLHFISSMGEALGFLHLGRRLLPADNGIGMPTIEEDKEHRAILHRDIKLENVFLRWSTSNKHGLPDIVLGDFGGAVLEAHSSGGFGTSGYWPPEVLRYMESAGSSKATPPSRLKGLVMTKASDIYTFGACLCYMMLWGDYIPGMDIEPAFRKSNLRNWPLLLDLLKGCLDDEPLGRPSTETLLNWAPVLSTHISFLHEHGVRMAENSWAYPEPVARSVSTEAIHQPSPVYSRSVMDASTAEPDQRCRQPSVKIPGRSLSTVYDDATLDEPIVQTAKLVRFQKPARRPGAVDIRERNRTSILFDVVERLANGLLMEAQKARLSKTLADSRFVARLSARSRRRPLVSKFSEDSDGELD